jgi:hypothetical protein
MSYLVTVCGGHDLPLVDCWFSGSRERELNTEFFVLHGCMFEQTEFPLIQFESERPVRRAVAKPAWRAVAKPVAAAAGIAALLALTGTPIIIAAQRRLGQRKLPWAIE